MQCWLIKCNNNQCCKISLTYNSVYRIHTWYNIFASRVPTKTKWTQEFMNIQVTHGLHVTLSFIMLKYPSSSEPGQPCLQTVIQKTYRGAKGLLIKQNQWYTVVRLAGYVYKYKKLYCSPDSLSFICAYKYASCKNPNPDLQNIISSVTRSGTELMVIYDVSTKQHYTYVMGEGIKSLLIMSCKVLGR